MTFVVMSTTACATAFAVSESTDGVDPPESVAEPDASAEANAMLESCRCSIASRASVICSSCFFLVETFSIVLLLELRDPG